MRMEKEMKIVIIGAGNMATQLCHSFAEAGQPIWQALTRSKDKAEHLLPMIQDGIYTSYHELIPDADVYLISVNDSAISSVARQLSSFVSERSIIAHTAGNTPITAISDYYDGQAGVFYPLQSVRRERPISMKRVPLLINGTTPDVINRLLHIASIISDHCHECSDADRSGLHLPAVMVNNFVNYLYHSAYQYCEASGLPFEHLHALIAETAERIVQGEVPASVQTGPAIRQDNNTMSAHEERLRDMPDQLELYQHISNLIMKMKTP